MSLGTITIHGVEVAIEAAGMSMVQNINGRWAMHISLRPVLPNGPRGGEPMPIEDAA